MTDETPDQEFWDVADSFINLANDHLERTDGGKVNSALLYAAARFSAFVVASMEDSDIAEEKHDAIDFFTKQYRTMLTENIEDYQDNPPEE